MQNFIHNINYFGSISIIKCNFTMDIPATGCHEAIDTHPNNEH